MREPVRQDAAGPQQEPGAQVQERGASEERRRMPPLQRARLLGTVAARMAFRAATSRWRTLPSVFILGAPKGGTSTLSHYLSLHPAYVGAATKEPMFLQDLPNFVSNQEEHPVFRLCWGRYSDDLLSYRKFFPLNRQIQAASRRTGVTAVTGDHTPFYLYCPVAAERIRRFAPHARLIVMLRDPVARTYSDYNMHRERTTKEKRTFEQAIDDELSGACTDFRHTYLHQGIYEPHLRRWMEMFPREQLLILSSESFFRDPRSVLRRVHEFIGLPPVDHEEQSAQNKGSYKIPMNPETRSRLGEYFRPHNRRLYDLLSIDFGWDKSSDQGSDRSLEPSSGDLLECAVPG